MHDHMNVKITVYQASHNFITKKKYFLFDQSPLEGDGAEAQHLPAPQECPIYVQIIQHAKKT